MTSHAMWPASHDTKMRRVVISAGLLLLLATSLPASTPASFRGRVIEFPTSGKANMIFVMSRNGSLRRVDVAQAKVSYSEDVPVSMRRKQPSKHLKHGTEVRVLAEENGHGMWRAHSVEILALPGAKPRPKAEPDTKPSTGPVLSRRTA